MSVTLESSGIRFPDSSLQTTAATAGGPPTTLYAVGTYVVGRPQNLSTYGVNSTIAGSSLYSTDVQNQCISTAYGVEWQRTNGRTLVNTGSWRCVSPCGGNQSGNAQTFYGMPGLWVRYA